MISFLTNRLTVFSRAVKHSWFSFVWLSFGLLEFLSWSFRESKLSYSKMETSRFVEITDEELIELVDEQENPNTKRKTAYDVELFKSFIQISNPGLLGSTSLHELSPQVLNDLLSKFIFGVRKQDGSNYEPTSLRGYF